MAIIIIFIIIIIIVVKLSLSLLYLNFCLKINYNRKYKNALNGWHCYLKNISINIPFDPECGEEHINKDSKLT